MIKRSPSRNQRSKGIKVKHVLQIILLLGVCFWLIYQVKHSHDKKKEFDESSAHLSVGTQTENQIPKLGRKDLHPGKGEVNQNEKHEEEVEDESIEEEDENKHELDEQEEEEGNEHETEGKEDGKHGVRGGEEEDENKSEEMEDERRGADDEIDENDQDKSEVDTDRDEFVDEEKEKEESDEKDNENTEDEEKEGSVENHHTHEAREEHYKGDDASSAVTHDTHTTSTETETVSLENYDNSEKSIMKSENKPNYTEETSWARDQTDSDIKVKEVELTTGGTSNSTSGIETGNSSLSNPVDSSHLNSTPTTHSDTHSEEANSNLTIANPGASNNMTQTGADTSSEQNKMGIFSESYHAQNDTKNTTITVDVKNVQTEELQQGGNRVSEEHPESNATATIKTENGNAAAGESANLEGGGLEKTTRFVASNETENKDNTGTSDTSQTQNNSFMKDNTDATGNEKLKGGTQTGESSGSSTGNGTANSIDHNATDSHILKDVTESHTDPGTLPDIRNEGDDSGKTVTE